MKAPIFLFNKQHRRSHGDVLVLTKPLLNNSSICTFNSFSSAGAIRYDGIEMGSVPGASSISNSISPSGGNPGRSLGNTSKNSFTIGTSANYISLLPDSIAYTRYPWHALRSILFACITLIKLLESIFLSPQKITSGSPG